MDLALAGAFLARRRLARHGATLGDQVHELPADVDEELASLKLGALGLAIDRRSDAQQAWATESAAGT